MFSGRYPSAEQRGNVVQQFRGRAGRSGAVDPGHDGSWEVFYCVAGLAIVDDGDTEYALHAGDALVIPSQPAPRDPQAWHRGGGGRLGRRPGGTCPVEGTRWSRPSRGGRDDHQATPRR